MDNTILNNVLEEFKEITGLEFDASSLKTNDLDFAIEQLKSVCNAYKEKHNITQFLQNLIHGNLNGQSLYKEAAAFHLPIEAPRALFLLETKNLLDETVLTVVNYMFSDQSQVQIVPISEHQIVLLHPYNTVESYKNDMTSLCHMIVDTLNTEALIPVKISCGSPNWHLSELSSSYQQALTALNIGKRFHLEQSIFFYDELGIDRLVYHLPNQVCEDFLNEVWKNKIPTKLDSELSSLISCFLQNNLNIAETARQLHMHRNTLIYRIEKIEAQTNLDIRNFEDAMTLRLALMIMNNRKK